MKTIDYYRKKCWLGDAGFSLIELMVVVCILGILAASVGVYIKSESTKLKSFVFNTRTRFNQAKFEAIKRSRYVYLDFDFDNVAPNVANDGNMDNGFTIWVDEDDDGVYIAANGDVIVGTPVVFDNILNLAYGKNGPEIYNPATVTGGPAVANGPGGNNIGIGITADSNAGAVPNPNGKFKFRPNGDSVNGSAYFYFPRGTGGAKSVEAGPWAIIVNNVGRIRIDQWDHLNSGDWDVD